MDARLRFFDRFEVEVGVGVEVDGNVSLGSDRPSSDPASSFWCSLDADPMHSRGAGVEGVRLEREGVRAGVESSVISTSSSSPSRV